MNILADASLPGLIEAFPTPFKLTRYKHNDEVSGMLKNQDILLCRASLKVDHLLLSDHTVRYVATASSGSDNLDLEYLKSKDIIPIDAKGCNAVSVADYVLSCFAYLETNYYIQDKKIGIIGLGHVGSLVYKRLKTAGFELFAYDPIKALRETGFKSCTQQELYECDVLCVHAELHNGAFNPSFNLINKQFLNQLKPGCIIINAARGGIVNEDDLLNASPKLIYCTDVYLNEPYINQKIIEQSLICTPHIAGHSIEAKYAAVSIVSQKIHQLLGLPSPSCAEAEKTSVIKLKYNCWQELALALYNPIYETQLLKQTSELASAFISLRTQHTKRHNFAIYLDKMLDSTIKQIFT